MAERGRLYSIEGSRAPKGLAHGGGNDNTGGMEARLTKLETHMEYVRRDLDEIKAGNKSISEKLDGVAGAVASARAETAETIFKISERFSDAQVLIIKQISELPSRRDLQTYSLTAAGIGLAVIAIVIGGIIGGLSWIKP